MIEDLVKQIETRFAELGEQMTDAEVISDRERYAEVGRAYSQLGPPSWRLNGEKLRTRPVAPRNCSRRRVRTLSCARSSAPRASGSRSSRRRSAWRWSNATPTTTRA
jgi:hypothetical protein